MTLGTLSTSVTMDPSRALDRQVDSSQIREHHVEVQVQRLLDDLVEAHHFAIGLGGASEGKQVLNQSLAAQRLALYRLDRHFQRVRSAA